MNINGEGIEKPKSYGTYCGEATNAKENSVELIGFVHKFWVGFHNLIIAALLFTLMGIGAGVKVSQQYYIQKLDEVVQTGAMLHKQKVYTIHPKI